MSKEITISLDRIIWLLNQQKAKVIDRLLQSTSYYNQETTDGHQKSLKIDKGKFEETGLSAKFPDDILVLIKYLGEDNS